MQKYSNIKSCHCRSCCSAQCHMGSKWRKYYKNLMVRKYRNLSKRAIHRWLDLAPGYYWKFNEPNTDPGFVSGGYWA